MLLLGIKHGERVGIISIGILGAALLYGDGAITPAISVLSALEGIKAPIPPVAALRAAALGARAHWRVRPAAPGQRTDGWLFGPIMTVCPLDHLGAQHSRHPSSSACSRRSTRVTGSATCSPTG